MAHQQRGKDDIDIDTMRNKFADGNHRPRVSGLRSSEKSKIHTELAKSTKEFDKLWTLMITTLDTYLPFQTTNKAKIQHLTRLLTKGHTINVLFGRELNPVLATTEAKVNAAEREKCL